jgi:hypothetical protein
MRRRIFSRRWEPWVQGIKDASSSSGSPVAFLRRGLSPADFQQSIPAEPVKVARYSQISNFQSQINAIWHTHGKALVTENPPSNIGGRGYQSGITEF